MTRSKWGLKEDVALMSSWCFVSEDKACGRNKKAGSLWPRIHKLYEEARKENPGEIGERNIESMRGRYKRLNVNGNKWVAAYKEAHGRKRSGMSQLDVLIEAHTIYQAGGRRFEDLYVFNEVMSKHPKWEINLDNGSTRLRLRVEDEEGNEESGGGSKRSRTDENGVYSIPSNPETPETPGSGSSTISRPVGRDKESKKEKNTEIAAEIRALRLTRDTKNLEIEREKLDFERKKMQHSILMTLLAKDHLSPFEEEMKLHLFQLFK